MKPAPFEYHRPETIDGVLSLLATYGDEAMLLAGGQSLVPMMNMRLARPAHVIDINRVPGLSGVRRDNVVIEVGALTRHADLAADPVVRRHCPILAHAASTIGHYAIRQRGTLGGSLSLADPSAQLPLVTALLEAEIVMRSARGERSVCAGDFFIAAMTTDRTDGEMITAVRYPLIDSDESWGFELFSHRAGDFAIVLAAATLKRDAQGRIAAARLALGGIAGVPLVLTEELVSHAGRTPDPSWPKAVAEEIACRIEPEGSRQLEGAYKRDLSQVLVERAFAAALGAARQAPA